MMSIEDVIESWKLSNKRAIITNQVILPKQDLSTFSNL